MRKYIFILLLLSLAIGCRDNRRLDAALEFAGENRVELERVLEHYRDSGLKYEAARFLIENMPGWYAYRGMALDSGKAVLLSMGEGEGISLAVSGVYEDSSSYSQFCSAYAEKSVLEALYASAERDMPNNRLIVSVESSSYLSAVREDLETLGYTVTGENASLGDIMSSLVVSAIMIFIVLYISVIERTKEIGVLRAIGGSKGNIKTVFLFEAGFLGAIAGGIAVALSLLIAVIVNVSTASLGVNIVAYSYGLYYFAGLALSILLSVCAGIAPASYAAALDPVESLRRE